ncbi:hypothetical protein JW879_06840 [candidate division WOR-3 bacterium]|nr:hypothetical protein [candidate division WOR-3 bacterium]
MNREEELKNKYFDGVLSEKEKKELKKIISKDKKTAKELKEMDKLKEVIDMLEPVDPEKEWEKYWSSLYNKLERGIGWIIFSIGAILTITFFGFQFIKELIRDPHIALFAKIGLIALISGLAILFVSVVRERLTLSKTDKYSKEVER